MQAKHFSYTKVLWLLCITTLCFTRLGSTAEDWTVFEDCKFSKDNYADGDSFSIAVKRSKYQTYIFRLYFVDTPESDTRIQSRIEDQAAYWNISTYQTIELGEQAAEFAKKWLSKRELRVSTRFRDAMGASKNKRYYAMVQDKETEEYLSMALVRAGLARIYGFDAKLADGTSATSYNNKLDDAEKLAQAEKLGGWGLTKPDHALDAAESVRLKAKQNFELDHSRRVATTLRVYSLKPPYRPVGILKRNMEFQCLGAAQPRMIRVRFTVKPDRIIEAQCKSADIKVNAPTILPD